MKTTAILTTTLGLALASLHAQTVPPFINYQGRVTDSNNIGLGTGTPVNRKVIFRIFDAPSAGARLWSEQHTVTISNGEFSVLLGNGINANYAGADEIPLKTTTPLDTVFTSAGILRYVEIVVDNGDNTLNAADAPIAPRQQITSTAYSFRARSADTIASGTDLQLNGSPNYGLGYYGSTRLFNGTAVDGPVLFGQAGGALGSVNGGTKNIALRWNANGAVGIGSADLTGAAGTTKLVLQGDDANDAPMQLNIRGNSDTNKRLLLGYNTSSNYGSLQAYNGVSTATNLMLNPSGGYVGIGGTVMPESLLHLRSINVNGASVTLTSGGVQSAITQKSSSASDRALQFQNQTASGGNQSFMFLNNNATNLMTILADGNVGIGGNTGPSQKLDVTGNARVSGNVMLSNTSAGGAAGVIQLGSSRIHNYGSNNFNFFAGEASGNFTMTGGHNVGIGMQALLNNSTGGGNTAIGNNALNENTGGINNAGLGHGALYGNTTGEYNIALGYFAGYNLTTGGNNIAIGNYGAAGASNTIWLGTAGTHTKTILAGNVGIGTDLSGAPLSTNLVLQRDDANTPSLQFSIRGNSDTNKRLLLGYNTTSNYGSLQAYSGTSTTTNLMLNPSGGNVGIGTTTPTQAKLVINGSGSSTNFTADTFDFFTYLGGVVRGPAGSYPLSLFASGRIAASHFMAFSDERMKKIEGQSDGAMDLGTLLGLEITDYRYKDVVGKGNDPQKKVIAQQVEQVFPQAVSKSTDVVPDIYQKAVVKDGWVKLATDLKQGERVRLIGEKKEGIHEVLEVAEGRFRTDFMPEGDQVFVYGREVNDFRSVDYEAIAMLNVSATQELARKLDEKNTQIAELQKRVVALETKDQARDAKMASIEQRLAAASPATVTVSLKQGE